jgi:hypothetical protein
MMILAVGLEVVLQLENSLAQDRNLHLRRTSIGLVDFILRDDFRFQICRQCHARVKTPRLTLIFEFMYDNRITQGGPNVRAESESGPQLL